ncbi:uncharacterized protein OCT59_017652 [Rhizophagus irregularis]|uniref:uncharacterized protein n=1 Tax=Rhizophagus irregularis TaxID=588596 RepID=UPI001C14EC89|nr:hypothetical protein OCT59_017652 [Rhizophagus irregularis]CAB5216284.1 unnamed protein product [Rhizophagus irregularis]CAG8643522.1 3348_t:CDS:2 [Rhizophagus irregularis]
MNDIEKGQGEFMESSFVNAQEESTDSLRKKPPYPQDGEKSPIHILIYHSGTDPPEVGQVLQRNVNAQRNFGQVQTLITPDEDQALLPKINYEPPSKKWL